MNLKELFVCTLLLLKKPNAFSMIWLCWRLFLAQKLYPKKQDVAVRAMGYHINGASYYSVLFLIREMFLEEQYLTVSTNSHPFIVDAGSNIGMSMLYFKRRYPHARILCFEPQQRAYEFLKKNILQNKLSGVEAYHAAISSSTDPVSFYTPSSGTGLMASMYSSRETRGVMTKVPGVKLSDYLSEPPDILKIDIEGAEGLALTDLAKTGKLTAKQILLEFHHGIREASLSLAQTLALLEQSGYSYTLSAARAYPQQQQDIFIHAIKTIA